MAERLKQLLIAIDQLLNCFIGLFIGGSWADETWSARSWRQSVDVGGKWNTIRKLIDRLFWWDTNHCYESWRSEKLRLQSPPSER